MPHAFSFFVLPYVNLGLDLLGLSVLLILVFACAIEHSKHEVKGASFLTLLLLLSVSLAADAMGWFCHARPSLRTLSLVSHTVADCASYLSLLAFMRYLKEALYYRSRAAAAIVSAFDVLGVIAIVASAANAHHGFSYTVTGYGVYISTQYPYLLRIFPCLALLASVVIVLRAARFPFKRRLAVLLCTLFPLAGVLIDAFFPFSMFPIGMLIAVLLIYTALYLQRRRIITDQRNALMISQINPHFMYNTLTAAAALCDTSPREAKALIVEFSSYLRRNISALGSNALIPFEDELRHVGCYLKIEKARFGERLHVVYNIKAKDFSLPVLSVQPLVENAVKHGITKKREGGTVRISTWAGEKCYFIEVLDDGVGFAENSAFGEEHVGLQNVRERLKSMCGGTLTVRSIEGVGTRITVQIPKGGQK